MHFIVTQSTKEQRAFTGNLLYDNIICIQITVPSTQQGNVLGQCTLGMASTQQGNVLGQCTLGMASTQQGNVLGQCTLGMH